MNASANKIIFSFSAIESRIGSIPLQEERKRKALTKKAAGLSLADLERIAVLKRLELVSKSDGKGTSSDSKGGSTKSPSASGSSASSTTGATASGSPGATKT